ncbi:MAG TPA: prolyl oligopeptidase family serine peptidase [Vicinamibacterales bacterium]|nr:prolyl oligopeptidase family serine peptidase [Vicinamibacterales bacterium]
MRRAASLLTVALLAHTSTDAQPARFSAEDMLKVVTASVQDLSEDGRLVAFTERRTHDNAETDHYRYGDPTYLGPSAVRLVVVDTQTGERKLPLGESLAHVRQAAFSRDGKRLAILIAAAAPASGATPAISLLVWPTGGGPAAPVTVKSADTIVPTSTLDWTPDGTRVVVSMRTAARERAAAERFTALTRGPIIVHSSKDSFLEWDDMNRLNRWRNVVDVDVATGVVTTRVPERKVTNYRMGRDGTALVLQEDTTEKTDYDTIGGTDNRLLLWARGESEPRTLLAAKDFKGLTPRWSDDLKWMAYAKQGEVFVREIPGGEPRSLTPKPKPKPDEKPGTPPVLTPEEKKEAEAAESFSVESFSRDATKVLVTSRKGWYVVTLADGARRQIFTLDVDEEKNPRIAALDWAPDGSAIYATMGARDRWDRGVVRIDTTTGRITTLVKDARLYGNLRLSRDGGTFVFSGSDGDRPAELQVADSAWRQVRTLTKLNTWLDGRPLAKSELVKYRDVDGKPLYGVLRYPVNYVPGQKYPTVFEIYETFFENGFNARAAFLASHGYAVFHPSVNLVVGRPGEAWVKGVTTAANRLIEMGVADPDRLGVHGTSYGGYATVLLLTQTDRFKAAINISGKVDMVSFYTDSPRLGVRNTHAPEKSQDRIGGTLWEFPERYLEHSAVLRADRIKTPLLNITGDQDPNVPASQSREIYYALRRLGRDVEWVRYVNGAHRPPNSVSEAIDFENRILAWYDKYLKSDEKKAMAGRSGS